MLFFTGLINTWPLCVAFAVFYGAASCAAWWFPWRKCKCTLPSGPTLIVLSLLWVAAMGVCLTFVDSPFLNLSKTAIDWLFMLFAFLVMLAGFGMGCAASNIHDVAWCGIITKWYTQPYAAGGDLLAFATVGQWFGIPEKVLYDYAALGPCAAVMVLGELVFAAACLARMWYNEGAAALK